MKYSFTALQPRSNAELGATSDLVVAHALVDRVAEPLASGFGAKVKPPGFPPGAIASTRSTVNASTRVLGIETERSRGGGGEVR